MAIELTPNSGIQARYFHVYYNGAERQEHFAAIAEMDRCGIFNRMLNAAPDLRDFSRTLFTFVVDEKAADAYIRRIAAAKLADEAGGKASPAKIGATDTSRLQ